VYLRGYISSELAEVAESVRILLGTITSSATSHLMSLFIDYFNSGVPGVQIRGDAEASDSAGAAARSMRRAFIRT